MSQPLPPSIVKIKRKATDEPLEFLRVHEREGKRQRLASDYIFSRQVTPEAGDESATSQTPSLGLRKIKQPHRSASSLSLSAKNAKTISQTPSIAGSQKSSIPPSITPRTTNSRPGTPIDSDQAAIAIAQPRRFHISRSVTPSNPLGPSPSGLIRKRKVEPTVFVERRIRKGAEGTPGADSKNGKASPEKHASPSKSAEGVNVLVVKVQETEEFRPRKRPGLAARSSTPPVRALSPHPKQALRHNITLPSGKVMPWDVNSDQLVREMQAYTLQEIGKTITKLDAPEPVPTPVRKPQTPSKFKPKAPALRYHERHPSANNKNDGEMEIIEPEVEDEEMDDTAEYVFDTYIRKPAEEFEHTEIVNFGLLCLPNEEDIADFYNGEEESEEEEDFDEDDENAENHYTADYPDDEVSSDDEYGRNAYHYRTRGASDNEEFDEADATFSDDEDGEKLKFPWLSKTKHSAWLEKEEDGLGGDPMEE